MRNYSLIIALLLFLEGFCYHRITKKSFENQPMKQSVYGNDCNDQSTFTVYGNGNVVMGDNETGSADNTSKLMVDGLIAAREVRVRMTSFPDYVFKDDYKRLTKEKLKAFIAKNGHLPFFPSEKDVIENGLSLGEFQQKMVEAIENLYLIILND